MSQVADDFHGAGVFAERRDDCSPPAADEVPAMTYVTAAVAYMAAKDGTISAGL